MNTNTQTVDERCAEMAALAFDAARVSPAQWQREMPHWHADDFCANAADAIIAEREREASALREAEAAQAEGGAL